MTNDTSAFLSESRHKARHIRQSDNRDIECVAEHHKFSALVRRINVQATRFVSRLVRNDAHDHTINAAKARNDIFRKVALDFKPFVRIHQTFDYFVRIKRMVRIGRNDFVHAGIIV